MSNYCSKMRIGCNFANSNGYCSITGCIKPLTWNNGNELKLQRMYQNLGGEVIIILRGYLNEIVD